MTTTPSDLTPTPPAPPLAAAGSPAPDPAGRIQSVERAARILLAFGAPGQQVTVAELARMLGVHKITASRIVATLVAAGLLARGTGGPGEERLRLGPELARLGRLAAGGAGLKELAAPVMGELGEATGEGVTLAVFDDGAARTIAQLHTSHVIGMQDWVGREAPLHATSDGKVLLAFGAATGAGALGGAALEACTAATITSAAALGEELALIRDRGWAISLGEFEPGLHGIAAPVVDPGGVCRAALCISGPSYRLTEAELVKLGPRLRAAADRIGLALNAAAGEAAR